MPEKPKVISKEAEWMGGPEGERSGPGLEVPKAPEPLRPPEPPFLEKAPAPPSPELVHEIGSAGAPSLPEILDQNQAVVTAERVRKAARESQINPAEAEDAIVNFFENKQKE